jgi:Rieske Fe-S protein
MGNPIARRRAITGTAAVCVCSPLLAACGGNEDSTATDPASPSGNGAGSPSQGEGSSADGGTVLVSTGDVPVNGCFVVSAAKVVVTQPAEGEFKAFSATCTHQGCAVSDGSDGVIPCKCHGSQFSLEDGSVLEGPANRALDPVEITVEGDQISLA